VTLVVDASAVVAAVVSSETGVPAVGAWRAATFWPHRI
jgi:hypothetical protein